MANLIKIGERIINIDQVTEVSLCASNQMREPVLRVFFAVTDGGNTCYTDFRGDNASALRSWLERVAVDVAAVDAAEPADLFAELRTATKLAEATDLLAEIKAALRVPGGPMPKLEAVRAVVASFRKGD